VWVANPAVLHYGFGFGGFAASAKRYFCVPIKLAFALDPFVTTPLARGFYFLFFAFGEMDHFLASLNIRKIKAAIKITTKSGPITGLIIGATMSIPSITPRNKASHKKATKVSLAFMFRLPLQT
jgi:hypothetical protein